MIRWLRKIDWWVIIFVTACLWAFGQIVSEVQAAPAYPDTLTAYSTLEKQMWNAGCRRTEPEIAEPIEIKVYKSGTGTLSGIITQKIRSKCILYPIAAPVAPVGEVKDNIVTVDWDAPTTRVNGYPIAPSELAGYHVYLDGVKIGETSGLTFQFVAPAPGAHRITIKAIDTVGLQSDFSPAWEFSI